ncbi:hypothetical protein CANARDRAFT_9959 [[Candida] arabinofermentans NRRL YB-2248]|uniref:Golgi to ER traffic protein 2 n=1 Tax=[Candida] arabinofermentans NRRL YB-2248 TaxID=983967 RepID=A0A1E4SUE1_9ASCO|nr:hypothetical protein CANARDRAFT_9959 [[Candida] arabinofermentans NRRL YB-2248]
MSEISAAEKRRILREKRAAKLATNSSDRLGKITGSVGSHLPTKSSLGDSSPDQTATTPSTTSASSSSSSSASETATATASRKKSNRISQSFQDRDPETSDINTLISNDAQQISSEDDVMSKLLENLMKNGHDHIDPQQQQQGGGNGLLPDDFMKTMSSLLQQGENGGFGGNIPEEQEIDHEANDYQQKLKQYNTYENKRAKLIFIIIRFILIIRIVYNNLIGDEFAKPSFNKTNWKATGNSFWISFIFYEILFSLIYFIGSNYIGGLKDDLG